MHVKVGNLSFTVPIQDVIFTPEEMQELANLLASQLVATAPPTVSQTPAPPEDARSAQDEHIIHDLSLIKSADIPQMTFVIIANRVLGLKTNKRTMASSYPALEQAASKWLTRPIQEPFMGLFLAKSKAPLLGPVYIAVGLNRQSQLVTLGVEEARSAEPFLRALIARGLKPKDIEVGVLGLDQELERAFQKAFPKAVVARDWDSVIEAAPEAVRPELREVTFLSSEKSARSALQKALKKHSSAKPIVEPQLDALLAYYQFPEGLQRVLRNLNPIYRLEREYVARTKHAKNERDAWLLVTWCTMRLQYHWFKIPVDAPQLSNLRYVKELGERRAER